MIRLQDLPQNKWLVFAPTKVNPTFDLVTVLGAQLPIGCVYWEPVIVWQPSLVFNPDLEVFTVTDGRIVTLRGYWRAYYNLDPAVFAEARTPEEAIAKLRHNLSLDFAGVHNWRAMEIDDYTDMIGRR